MGFRSATAAEVLAVHRAPYLELLERVVRTKAPSTVEGDTYITHTSYDDAFHVRGRGPLASANTIAIMR